jgi:ribosomal protein L40E
VGAAVTGVYGAAVEKMFFGPPLIMLILGGMTLALCGMALWRVIDPLTHGDASVEREARGPGRARELEREKQAVLKAIKEVELDHQMRKIADSDYREMIERYRGRALRLISEIEAGDNFRELIERELKDRLAALPAIMAATAPPASSGAAAAQAAIATASATTASATNPWAAQTGCSACGTVNDPDAQFCKKCGVKLAA